MTDSEPKQKKSSSPIQTLRGMHDILPEQSPRFRHIVDTSFSIAKRYGYEEMFTPVLEDSALFHKSLGESSDVIGKELYTFLDRGGDSVSLRPETTAGIARAFISEGLNQKLPLKLFTWGPMFRYERPQKGRLRQFHQVGVEVLGIESPCVDAETIELGFQTLKSLEIADFCSLHVNSIGDLESRRAHRESLNSFLAKVSGELSGESQKRALSNPLRIFDSKDARDIEVMKSAPQLKDFFNVTSGSFFETLCKSLQTLNLNFQINPNLVRGFDYYCHTVFEFRTQNLGAQDAVLSGGRYDQLIESMGGPATPGMGWGAGIERIEMLMPPLSQKKLCIAVVPMGENQEMAALQLTQQLRNQNLHAEMIFSGNASKRMKKAAKLDPFCALLLGESELKNGEITVKNFKNGTQTTVKSSDIITSIENILQAPPAS